MLTILSLFGRSPFIPLQAHMEKVAACMTRLEKMFAALFKESYDQVEQLVDEISELEHAADLAKEDIRANLPSGIFLPIDKANLLDILSLQDGIADTAQDIGILVTLRKILPAPFAVEDFKSFLAKNLEAFHDVHRIALEWAALLESSFGGVEAQKVRQMIHSVGTKEHEVDVLQRKLLKELYNSCAFEDYRCFHLWLHICQRVARISDLSEKLAFRIRLTLDNK